MLWFNLFLVCLHHPKEKLFQHTQDQKDKRLPPPALVLHFRPGELFSMCSCQQPWPKQLGQKSTSSSLKQPSISNVKVIQSKKAFQNDPLCLEMHLQEANPGETFLHVPP